MVRNTADTASFLARGGQQEDVALEHLSVTWVTPSLITLGFFLVPFLMFL